MFLMMTPSEYKVILYKTLGNLCKPQEGIMKICIFLFKNLRENEYSEKEKDYVKQEHLERNQISWHLAMSSLYSNN